MCIESKNIQSYKLHIKKNYRENYVLSEKTFITNQKKLWVLADKEV